MTIGPNELMIGSKAVCDAFSLSRDQFYMFLALGLPMRKINGRWYGHRDNISGFFRNITLKKPPIVIDTSAMRSADAED